MFLFLRRGSNPWKVPGGGGIQQKVGVMVEGKEPGGSAIFS